MKRYDGIRANQLLMSRNGTAIDVFQIPNTLLVDRLNRYIFPFLLPVTRHHWRNCILHHTNESIKFTDERQLFNFRKGFVRNWSALSFNGCPCSYTKATRLGPVKVQRLYVVPFFSKLDVFSIVEQPSLSIEPLPFQESYSVSCCCFSPDGCFLATCANGCPLSILIWDTKLCIIMQFLRFQLVWAERCWWAEGLLWIYDGGLVKIPILSGQNLNPSGAQRVLNNLNARRIITFSDVLLFIDIDFCTNIVRIKAGEVQYVEKLPVDREVFSLIRCAAVSSCNSVILTVNWTTFHVWKEDQSLQPLHWKVSITGKLFDILGINDNNEKRSNLLIEGYCKCAITSDGSRGVLAVCLSSKYYILVDLNSKTTTWIRSTHMTTVDMFFVGNSYCITVQNCDGDLVAEELSSGKIVAKWKKSIKFDNFSVVAHSKNDLVAVISAQGASVQFLKIIVPD